MNLLKRVLACFRAEPNNNNQPASTAPSPSGSDLLSMTVGDIVANDFRTGEVMESHGIDFCCGGKMPLREACRQKNIPIEPLLEALEAVKDMPDDKKRHYNNWGSGFLSDYIINVHHTYIRQNSDKIASYTQKIADVHGKKHPELIEIHSLFKTVAQDLVGHLQEEEDVFFPATKRLEEAKKQGISLDPQDVEKLKSSHAKLNAEHEAVGSALHRIRHLSQQYTPPPDACNTYKLAYQQLKDFEDDLHQHVHLENNILFKRLLQQ